MTNQLMRPSRVLRKLRNGKVATCFKQNLADPRVTELVARSGFDCVWLDLEHVGNSISAIESGILAAKAHDVDVVVRVPRGSYSDLVRPLEMDATGIMVPHVMSLEDARSVVRQTRFHPLGLRPLDGGNADGGYGQVRLADYLSSANEQRFVIVQIEDPEPFEDLAAIATLPGIDMLFFGPGDFSQAIGAPGDWDHPRLLGARAEVARVATAQGKFAGTVGSPATAAELVALGYRFISLGADVVGLGSYCSELLDRSSAISGPYAEGPGR